MPTKPAKENFSREEVLDILQRNVELYKDEPGFAEYIVELTLYMIEKSGLGQELIPAATPLPIDYNFRGAPPRPVPAPAPVGADGGDVMPPTPPSAVRPRPIAPPPPANARFSGSFPKPPMQRPGSIPTPRPIEGRGVPTSFRSMDEVSLPSPNAFSRDAVPKPFIPRDEKPEAAPPPPSPVAPPSGLPVAPPRPMGLPRDRGPIVTPLPVHGRPGEKPEEGSRPSWQGGEVPPARRQRPADSAIEIARAPLQTPTPGAPLKSDSNSAKLDPAPGKPAIPGKTQVYRVVRPYKSNTSLEAPCRSCGAMFSMEDSHCPACGQQRLR